MSASPTLLFTPTGLPALRQRIREPELAPVWQDILQTAENRCNPKHAEYIDPADPFQIGAKGEHMPDNRHQALIVHSIGRRLDSSMESIGFAFQIAGREDLGRHAAAYLHAIATRYPATNETVTKGFAGGRGDVMRGLALGYDWVGELLPDGRRKEVAEVARGYLELFCREFQDPKSWWYKIHNYNGVNGGAAGCLALALRDEYPGEYEKWLDEAVLVVERWLSTGFDEEGAYFEGVGYSGYGLSNTVLLAHALRLAGSRHDLYAHPTLRRVAHFYAMSLLPGERVCDARNNSNYSGLSGVPLALAGALDSGLYRWLWDRSGSDRTFQRILWDNRVAPLDPVAAGVPMALHFRGRGLCVWRTGWEKDHVMFAIEAGPYHATTHNQADKGHFSLYGLGHRWATDTGYANEREPQGRGQAAAHSCVLIDGQGQARSGAGLGTDGEIVTFLNKERFGYALADCTAAYQKNNRGMAGVGVEYARRHAFFVYPKDQAPAYAVVLDDIRKDDALHDFSWQMMLSDDIGAHIDGSTALLAPGRASGDAYVDTPWTDGDEAVASVAPGAAPPGELVFDLPVETAGTYVVWARVRTEAKERAKADSFFVRMDDGPKCDWHMPTTGTWQWAKVAAGVKRAPLVYELKPGTHRLVFSRREPAAQIDCIVLSTETETPPALPLVRGDALFREAESGRVTAPMRVVRLPSTPTRLLVRVDASAPVTLAMDIRKTLDYHGPGAFPFLRADARAVNPRFAAVLLPLPENCPAPTVAFAPTTGGRTITVSWPDHVDTLLWPDSPEHAPTFR